MRSHTANQTKLHHSLLKVRLVPTYQANSLLEQWVIESRMILSSLFKNIYLGLQVGLELEGFYQELYHSQVPGLYILTTLHQQKIRHRALSNQGKGLTSFLPMPMSSVIVIKIHKESFSLCLIDKSFRHKPCLTKSLMNAAHLIRSSLSRKNH